MDKDELINALKQLPYGTKIFIGDSITDGQIVKVREITSVGTALSADDNNTEQYYGIIYLKPAI